MVTYGNTIKQQTAGRVAATGAHTHAHVHTHQAGTVALQGHHGTVWPAHQRCTAGPHSDSSFGTRRAPGWSVWGPVVAVVVVVVAVVPCMVVAAPGGVVGLRALQVSPPWGANTQRGVGLANKH